MGYDELLYELFDELLEEQMESETEFPQRAKRKAVRRKATARHKKKEARIEAIKKTRSLAKNRYKTAWDEAKIIQKKRSDRQATKKALRNLNEL